jgi:PAS domain S-box-containing protein
MVTGTSLFLGLFNNLAFFIVLVAIYGILNRCLEKTTSLVRQVMVGLAFGILSIACMYVKIPVAEGVIVDQRNTVVALCGAFGGPLAAVLCALMAGIYRISLGGAGALAGAVGVGLAALAGVIFFNLRDKIDSIFKAALSALAATTIILPGFLLYKDLLTGWELLKTMALPYGGAVYIGILFVGFLLAHQENSHFAQMELRRSEKRLRENGQLLDLALDGANEGIWDWDLESDKLLFDSRYYSIAGYLPDEFPAAFEEWEKRVHPDDIRKIKAAIEQYLSGDRENYDVEFRFLRKDGGYMWIRGRGKTVAHNENGDPIRFTGTHADITELKQAEEDLRKLRNYLSNIINSMPSVLVSVDREGQIIQWNQQAERVTGLLFDNVISKPLVSMYPRLASQIDNIKAAIHNRQVIHTSKVPKQEETETRYEDITIYPLVTNGDEGAVIRVDDVTREKEIEDELNTSRKMEAIGLLASGVAHDFNNMLAGIMGATELLGFYLPDEPKARKMHQMILDSAVRASNLTKQLLALSRQSDKISTVIKLHDIIEESLSLLKSSLDRRIAIEVNLDANQNSIVGDPSLLQNSFLNLCINASHAMPDGGLLKITTQEVEIDELFCQSSTFTLQPGRFIKLEIRDSGCGIPQEDLNRIFDPFFTTKAKGEGTGLGLSTVYGTIQQHNGAINVYSEVGKGTVFQILLPVTNKERPVVKDVPQAISGSGRILVVDDEEIMRITAQIILENLGYTVLLAENGKKAVELFHKEENKIDLVLLDMIMPVMNGRDCFEQLKKINPDVRVVISSGFSREEDLQEMMKDGLSGLIRKPYLTSALSRVIHDALNRGLALRFEPLI